MKTFVLAGKAKTVFQIIKIAAMRGIMADCPYRDKMKCSTPNNCWDCPVRQQKMAEVLRRQAAIEKLTAGLPADTQFLSPKSVSLQVICPHAADCDVNECSHRVPHNPITGPHDCSKEVSKCHIYTGHCEPVK